MARTASSKPAAGKKLTVTEIARLAGTSQPTVSKVINGRADVSEETRRRVQAVLDQVGFSKPLVSTKVSSQIELVVRTFEMNGSFPLLQGLLKWARGESLGVSVTELGRTVAEAREAINHVIDANPYGVVLLMSAADERDRKALRSRSIPYVVIDPVNDASAGDLSVSIDNWTGGLLAARHLTGLGHRRIALIAGPDGSISSAARVAGFEQGLREAGIGIPDTYREHGDFDAVAGYEAAGRLLDLDEPPTAVFALDDLMAVGAYKAAAERGVRIPDDLSVVGFDDIFPAEYLGPALTTIRQPFDDMARKAVDMIVRSRKGNLEDRSVVLPVGLVTRQSTAKPAGAQH